MIRFQKITTIYPEFEVPFRKQYPDYARLSYHEIYDRLIAACYGWSDYFSKYLGQLSYEAQELFANFELMQKAWAKENGVRFSRRNWIKEISLAQIKAFQPEVIFLEDLYVCDVDFRAQARAVCRRPVKIIGWRAAPTDDYRILKDLDLVMTCAPVFIEALERHGIKTVLMSHAFEPSILQRVGSIVSDLNFTFIGMIALTSGFHRQRYSHVRKLMETTPLEMWGEIAAPVIPAGNENLMTRLTGKANRAIDRLAAGRIRLTGAGSAESLTTLPADPLQQRHPEKFHAPVFGLDNFRVLGRSGLTFNCHIDCAENSAGNARLFEATGMGACLITDWKTNLPQIFEPDTEVVTYRSIDECIEKVNYLLEHQTERQRIAAAGQKRTLRDHTYVQRAAQLDEIIRTLRKETIDRSRAYSLPAG
jgi:spore maturation protein CgeB